MPHVRGRSNGRAAVRPGCLVEDAAARLAAELWDLGDWASTACAALRDELAALVVALDAGDASVLAPAFVLSAAVLRHLLADPLLPDELLPPAWPGPGLREDYDRYDAAFKAAWRSWFHALA